MSVSIKQEKNMTSETMSPFYWLKASGWTEEPEFPLTWNKGNYICNIVVHSGQKYPYWLYVTDKKSKKNKIDSLPFQDIETALWYLVTQEARELINLC